ncbi:hypothetical protein K2173_007527 [Erythroxylum novogranatense]|uniref:Cytochrome P450 n=1 Tax=Erythroxylum novogranatense TaxID=1862640 RepID=A0AAV8T7S9_9ROSI|nr:hypothetical protein K2173_007527 [Erythroxylum novogranatense]
MDIPLLLSTISVLSLTTLSGLLVFLIICLISTGVLLKPGKKRAAPEAGSSLPIIGHLHLLGGLKPTHIVLGDMVSKYGPIFTIKIGVRRALVISNWELVKECFTTNDIAFANRPRTLSMDLLSYERSMFVLGPYDAYWRQVRKIAMLELLSKHRLEMFKGTQESELRILMRELYKLWEQKRNGSNKVFVELKRWFASMTINVILKTLVRKSIGYETSEEAEHKQGSHQKLKLTMMEFVEMLGKFVMSDALPYLRWFDIGSHGKKMKRIAQELDIFANEWLKEHKPSAATGVNGEVDFMGLMLNRLQDSRLGRNPDTVIKATCLGLVLAGSDTTSAALTWALSLLLNHPSALKKAREEVDMYSGRERQVEEGDLKNMVYLQAVIKETLRLYPPGPLSIPHESVEDCTLGGYHIPAGTRLMVNIWKVHRDPRVWSNPHDFEPERFLTTHKHVDVRGQSFEYIPFGSGRRMCPGSSFALQVLQLALAKLLQSFDIATPSGEPVDMTENIGLTNPKATPLHVLIEPRLPYHLYG